MNEYDSDLYEALRAAGLSEREAEAVALRAEGYTYEKAAETMGISEGTFAGKMGGKVKRKLENALRLVALYDDHPEAFPEPDVDG